MLCLCFACSIRVGVVGGVFYIRVDCQGSVSRARNLLYSYPDISAAAGFERRNWICVKVAVAQYFLQSQKKITSERRYQAVRI
jgi:hypothetical protein